MTKTSKFEKTIIILLLLFVFSIFYIAFFNQIQKDRIEKNTLDAFAKYEMGGEVEGLRTDFAVIEGAHDGSVGFITLDGNRWNVDGVSSEEYQEDYFILLVFDTKGTDSLDDDEIIKIFKEVW